MFVVPGIDDPHDAPYRFITPEREEPDRLAVGEGVVLQGVEVLPFIHPDWRDPIAVSQVYPLRQIYESSEVLPVLDLTETDSHPDLLEVTRYSGEFYPGYPAAARRGIPARVCIS